MEHGQSHKELLPEIWRRRLLATVTILLACLILYKLRDILAPFVFAWVAAYLVSPVVNFLEQKTRLKREGAVNAVMAILLVFFVVLLLVTIPLVIDQTQSLIDQLPVYGEKMQNKIDEYQALGRIPVEAQEMINEAIEKAKESAPAIAQYLGGLLLGWLSSFFNFVMVIFSLIMFVFILYFFLRDFPKINKNIVNAVPVRYRERMREIVVEMDRNLKAVLRGQLLVALAVAVLYAFGLIVSGVPYGIIIGIVAGLGNFLPYVGPLLGMIPAILFVLLDHGFDIQAAGYPLIGIAITFGIVQFIEGFVLTPRFAGGSLGLGPVTTLFAISAGGVFLGFVGIVAALPAAAIVKVLAKRFWEAYTSSEFYQNA